MHNPLSTNELENSKRTMEMRRINDYSLRKFKSARRDKQRYIFVRNFENFDFELEKEREVNVNKDGPGAWGPLDPLKKTSLSLIRPRAREECHVNSIILSFLFCFSFACRRFLGVCRCMSWRYFLPTGKHSEKWTTMANGVLLCAQLVDKSVAFLTIM